MPNPIVTPTYVTSADVFWSADERLDLPDAKVLSQGKNLDVQNLIKVISEPQLFFGRVFFGFTTTIAAGGTHVQVDGVDPALAADVDGNLLFLPGGGANPLVALAASATNYVYAYYVETPGTSGSRRFINETNQTESARSTTTNIKKTVGFLSSTSAPGIGSGRISSQDAYGNVVSTALILIAVAVTDSGTNILSLSDGRRLYGINNFPLTNPASVLSSEALSLPFDQSGVRGVLTEFQYIAAELTQLAGGVLGPANARASVAITAVTGLAYGPTLQSAFPAQTGMGRLVAVGNNTGTGEIYSSDDWGNTWTNRQGTGAHNLFAVGYNGAQFVAVGATGILWTSPDGITWTSRTSNSGGNDLFSVVWSPTAGTPAGTWVASGANGAVVTSHDGITWVSRTTGLTSGNVYVTWGTGPALFLASSDAAAATNNVATSPDGITWTLQTLGSGATNGGWTYYAPYANGALFIVVSILPGVTPTFFTSPNGVTWTNQGTTPFGNSTPFYNGAFVFVGQEFVIPMGNGVVGSTTGASWRSSPLPFVVGSGPIMGIARGFGGLIYATSSSAIFQSCQNTAF